MALTRIHEVLMFKRCIATLTLALAGPLAAQTAGPAPTQQLTAEIQAADAEFFSAFFDRCDIAALTALVTEDLEMFHDKGGRIAATGKEFIKNLESTCARQKTSEDYRARRELVPGSLKVYPLNNYGAVETGEHRFYQLLPGKPEKLVEVALFTQVWKKEPGGWKLARVISYDHKLTPP
jgi:ketosteroid isomerase-like protein